MQDQFCQWVCWDFHKNSAGFFRSHNTQTSVCIFSVPETTEDKSSQPQDTVIEPLNNLSNCLRVQLDCSESNPQLFLNLKEFKTCLCTRNIVNKTNKACPSYKYMKYMKYTRWLLLLLAVFVTKALDIWQSDFDVNFPEATIWTWKRKICYTS